MAEKIRLGNDIGINWSLIDEDGNPYNLEGRDVSVEIDVGEKKRYRIKELSVSGNTVSFVYWGKDQKYTGRCDLKFIEKIRVFVTASNLYTLTRYTGIDPSVYPVNGMTPGTFGGSATYYPSAFQFVFGVQVGF